MYTYKTGVSHVVWNSQDIVLFHSSETVLNILSQFLFLNFLLFYVPKYTRFFTICMRYKAIYFLFQKLLNYFLVITKPYIYIYIYIYICQIQWYILRSQGPRGLCRRFAPARLLVLRFRTLPRSLMSVSFICGVLPGRDFCVGLITWPEESYRVCCVWVWSWSLDNEEAVAHWSCCTVGKILIYLIPACYISPLHNWRTWGLLKFFKSFFTKINFTASFLWLWVCVAHGAHP